MKFVIVLSSLLCACTAYNYMGYGMGMGGFGYPAMGGPYMGFGHRDSDDDDMQPQYLTCSNAELLPDGTTVFAVAVSVFDKDARQRHDSHSMFNPYMSHGKERSSLSMTIEILNTALTGTGLVAFTTVAQPEKGCALDGTADFGTNLTPRPDESSHGFGLGYGFGMGMGMIPNHNNDGIIAELPVTAGRVSSLTVDGLPFKSLDELAGRGIVICSSVNSDLASGLPTCERPMYACCSLSYDRTDHTII